MRNRNTGVPIRSASESSPESESCRLAAFRAVGAALCLIGSVGLTAVTHASEDPSKNTTNAIGTQDNLVTLTDALRIDQLPDADTAGSEAIRFAPGELIVRLRKEVGSQIHRARADGFASAIPGDPAAAQLDEILLRHKAKKMRRIFKVYEDAHGRQIDTARARLLHVREARQNQSKRRLPPLPAHTPDLENFFLVEIPGLETTEELNVVMGELRANDLVADVQPNFIHRIQAEPLPNVSTVPNDPYVSSNGTTWSEGSFGNAFPDLYGVRNLHVLEAWSLLDTNGNGVFDESEIAPGEGVVVAVIDSGLDLDHPDIAGGVFINMGETPGDGIDNDANGLVDDVSGWDFVDDDSVPEDYLGHGTHVAGTIAAGSNNAEGIVGIAPFAQILPIKALNDEGFGLSADLAAAVHYATSVGAHITSNSWGGVFDDPIIRAAFDDAEAAGVLSLAAAGNSARPQVLMPALFQSVVAVAAVDAGDVLASFSSWGSELELCAPGVGVLSLSANDHDNRYANGTGRAVGDRYLWLSGTSMATPHASGVAALMMSMHPDESAAEIRGRLLAGAVSIDLQNPGREDDLGAGRVDALSSATAVPTPLLRPVAIRAGAIVAGQLASVEVELRNHWVSATGVFVSLTSTDPDVSVADGDRDYGDMASGETASRSFEIQIAPQVELGTELSLLLTITADGLPAQEHAFFVRGSFFINQDDLAELSPFPFFVFGATFGDYDSDGLQDMGIGTALAATNLYRQNPDGTFSQHQPNGSGSTRYPIFVDMNNDGLLDMLAVGPAITSSAVLAINVGGGRFEVLPASSGFAFPESSQITGITPIDYDADGDLDLVVGVRALFQDDQGVHRNILVLRNNGDLTFSDAWAETGIGRLMGSHQYLTLDWNGDGFQDLLGLHRYSNRLALHRNLGKGKFEDVTSIAFPDEFLACINWAQEICDFFRTAAAGDYDNDGDTDLLLVIAGNVSAEDRSAIMLLENDGNGVYSDATDQAGDLATVTMLSGLWGTSFFDLENDGDLDILIPIDIALFGSPFRQPETKVVIFRNDGEGHFTHVSDIAFPTDTPVATLIAAVGDYDGDGAQDILAPVSNIIGLVGGLMHNQAGREQAWLEVELNGIDSAPNGYGARVTLVADGRVQTREIHYSPVELFRVHFGLGSSAIVNVLEIRWPSGAVGIQRDVAVNQRLSVTEGILCPDLQGGQCPTVEIDIDPLSDKNRINLHSNRYLRVAILGSENFDTANIDVARTFFGPARATAAHKQGGHIEDVNGDGLLDLVSHYRIANTGIELGDVEACLRGQLLDRTPFAGCDRVHPVAKKNSK
ncbi:MAG: VCBS repeat-containing protein [Myxococcales bacterium]|nr:VCBS repeat-containing protein [Myxococcales bacterium]